MALIRGAGKEFRGPPVGGGEHSQDQLHMLVYLFQDWGFNKLINMKKCDEISNPNLFGGR